MEDKSTSSSSPVSNSDTDVSDKEMSDSSEDSTPDSDIKIKSEPRELIEYVLELEPMVFSGVAASNYQDLAVSYENCKDEVDDADDPLFRRRKHLTIDEIRRHWNIRKIFTHLGTQEQCIQFALEKGLLPAERFCRRHRKPMKLQIKDALGRFRCSKEICRNRSFNRSDSTFFEGCKLKLSLVFEIMYFYCCDFTYDQTQRECYSPDRDTALSAPTISLWFGYCREAVVIYQIKHQKEKGKIGGPGRTVQIDESKLGCTKYKDGKYRRGHWMLGIIEEGHSDFRVDVFPDDEKRIAVKLVSIVKKHVIEGSTIRASDWDAYKCLSDHGYTVEVIADPDERPWQVLKRSYKSGNERNHYKGNVDFAAWLVELSWRKRMKVNALDPFENLIECIRYVYPYPLKKQK